MKPLPETWQAIKAKIVARYGSVRAAAAALDCTTQALHYAAQGKCPDVRKKLQAALSNVTV